MAIRLIAAFVVPTDLSGQNCSEEFFSSVLRPKVNLSFRCLLFDWAGAHFACRSYDGISTEEVTKWSK